MSTTQNLLLSCSSLFILSLIHFFQTCDASLNCSPSACGIITNISYPFRLNDDPNHCGKPGFELACENNVTFVYLNSQKYYVKAINYGNATIRVVDASINNDDTCSFPNSSAYRYNFTLDNYPYLTYLAWSYSSNPFHGFLALPIQFISCPHPLKNSSLFIDITNDCASSNSNSYSNSSSSSHPTRYSTYVKVGQMNASELPHTCVVDLIVMTSWPEFKDLNNVSLTEIHNSLLYGFELYTCAWWWCRRTTRKWEKFREFLVTNGLLLIPLAILVFIIAGVSLPVTIIVGLVGVLILSFTSFVGNSWLHTFPYYLFPRPVSLGSNFLLPALLVISLAIVVCLTAAVNILVAITIGFAGAFVLSLLFIQKWPYSFGGAVVPKYIYTGVISSIVISVPRLIICPLVVWFLIYKFRRRRLSIFDAIESFLQSDNKLVPIRYSYSDIKKMTQNFQDKLGQGGFGSVYKGRLRSGHLVGVKLLGKSGANGQDFMNEIATF